MASAAVLIPKVHHPRPVEKPNPPSILKNGTLKTKRPEAPKPKTSLTLPQAKTTIIEKPLSVVKQEPIEKPKEEKKEEKKPAGKRPREEVKQEEPPVIVSVKQEAPEPKRRKDSKKKFTLRRNLEGKYCLIFSEPVRLDVVTEICQSVNAEFEEKGKITNGWLCNLFDGRRLTLHPSEEEKEEYARTYRQEYRSRPVNVQKRTENSKKPEVIEKRKAYASRPDVIERKKQKAKQRRDVLRLLKQKHSSIYKELSGVSEPPNKKRRTSKDSTDETSTSSSDESSEAESEK
jgi:hypothetical protein